MRPRWGSSGRFFPGIIGAVLFISALVVPHLQVIPLGYGLGHVSVSQAHRVCSSPLGTLATGFIQTAARDCQAASVALFVSHLAMGAGVVLMLFSLRPAWLLRAKP